MPEGGAEPKSDENENRAKMHAHTHICVNSERNVSQYHSRLDTQYIHIIRLISIQFLLSHTFRLYSSGK